MNVAIAGGHGKIALLLAERLAARGDTAKGLIRNPEHEEDLRVIGASPVLADLEQETAETIARKIGGSDAVVFAAGAGPGSGVPRKWTVDFGGAAKLIAACKFAEIERYVIVSSIGAGSPPASGGDTFGEYLRAKAAADRALEVSGLAWTIVRPGPLTDDAPTGKIAVGEALDRGEITRADVAEIVVAALYDDASIGAAFEAVGGETPVAEAIAALAG
ncbi:MAG: SDR family oxidoreductase [Solirubrobacteraceae bacterium]|nr:SDR family oxidoreductase [Solirubrobacteraceae bacterium]